MRHGPTRSWLRARARSRAARPGCRAARRSSSGGFWVQFDQYAATRPDRIGPFYHSRRPSKIVHGIWQRFKYAETPCRARGSDSVSISMRSHALPLAASWPPAGCLPASQPFQLSLSSVHDRFCKQPRSFFNFFMHGGILGGSDLTTVFMTFLWDR